MAAILWVPLALSGQPRMPQWLAPYPGATAETASYDALVNQTYRSSAAPEAVTGHYRQLFEAANLPFVPNPDGMGVTMRASAPECDLLVKVHAIDRGSDVNVSCAARTAVGAPPVVMPVVLTSNVPSYAQTVSRPLTHRGSLVQGASVPHPAGLVSRGRVAPAARRDTVRPAPRARAMARVVVKAK